MNDAEFTETVREILAIPRRDPEGRVQDIVAAAREFQAYGIEQHARSPVFPVGRRRREPGEAS